jgi:hypothetical protein
MVRKGREEEEEEEEEEREGKWMKLADSTSVGCLVQHPCFPTLKSNP